MGPTLAAFIDSLGVAEPSGLSAPLRALWLDAAGNWNGAHKCVDTLSDFDSMWVHAYLHRREGDEWNAGYWYRRAGRQPRQGPLDDEWREIAAALIEKGVP